MNKIIIDKAKKILYICAVGLIECGWLDSRFTGKMVVNFLNGKITNVEKPDNLKF